MFYHGFRAATVNRPRPHVRPRKDLGKRILTSVQAGPKLSAMTFGAEKAIQRASGPMATAPSPVSDEEIARDVAARYWSAQYEEASVAFMELYERHSGLLWAFVAARTSRSDAEDVTQEIWQRVWKYLPERFHGGNFRAWLYEIARNYLVDCSRRQKNRPQLMTESVEAISDGAAPIDERMKEQEEKDALARCLEELGQRDAAALQIVRARLSGESYSKLCARLQLNEDRAYSLFHQAKKQLTGCVERGLP